jgi:putative inorganic carbon (hco3(-)) transporter
MMDLLLGLIFVFAPLARAGWDIWSGTVIHLVSLVILLLFLIKYNTGNNCKIGKTPLDWPILFFLLSLGISFLYASNKYNARNEFFNILNYIFLYYLVINHFKSQNKIDKLFYLFSFTGFMVSAIGIYHRLQGIQAVYSTMVNPNILAGYLVMVIILVTGFIVEKSIIAGRRATPAILWLSCCLAVMLFCLVLTRSVGGLLSLYVGLSILIVYYWKYKRQFRPGNTLYKHRQVITVLFFVFNIILIGIIIIHKFKDPELGNRLFWWQGALKMILDKPLTGVGIGCFGDVYLKYKTGGLNSLYAHNYFMQMGAEAGILSLAAFIWLLVLLFKRGYRKIKEMLNGKTPASFLYIGVFCAIIAGLMFSLIDYNMSIPANALILWMIMGIAMIGEVKTVCLRNKIVIKVLSLIILTGIVTGFIVVSRPFLASQKLAWGNNALEEGRLAEAELMLNKSIKLDNINSSAYERLAVVYSKSDRLDQAINELNKAAELVPDNALFHYELGLLYEQKGSSDLAMFEFREAISAHYQKIIYHLALKNLYEKQGLRELARKEYIIIAELEVKKWPR